MPILELLNSNSTAFMGDLETMNLFFIFYFLYFGSSIAHRMQKAKTRLINVIYLFKKEHVEASYGMIGILKADLI